MSKALMIQGTGSGAGKSLIVTALCRIFSDMGLNVAPFKSQNMALNSSITPCGGEIGRAQALQAEAARLEPTTDMNPILLKAQGDSGCQVILRGKVYKSMKAREYYAFKDEAWQTAKEAFDALSAKHDVIVIEGAGSPAEINLMEVDIVNMSVAKYAKAPVLLVGDIDKGGVFASLYGTVKLLGRDSKHIKGFIINKFRGDIDILNPGLEMIRAKTGKQVIGVLPYFDRAGLPEEDGLSLPVGARFTAPMRQGDAPSRVIKIVVLRLPFISNFTDFDPFLHEPDVELIYSTNRSDIEDADMVIIPGTKNTVKDLLYLKQNGLDESIRRAYSKGVQIVGICGGYQMLGKRIYDPNCIESTYTQIDGIGLLNIETNFESTKVTCRVEAEVNDCSPIPSLSGACPRLTGMTGQSSTSWIPRSSRGMTTKKICANSDIDIPQSSLPLRGYEIHMGTSSGDIGLFRLRRLPGNEEVADGSMNGNCWGTYIHGILDSDSFRRGIINQLRIRKGLSSCEILADYNAARNKAIDNLASIFKTHIDMDLIGGLLKL